MTKYKVECIFPMIISSEFRMGQYKDDGNTHSTFSLEAI